MSSVPRYPIIKMLLVGERGAGKTSIIVRYVDGTFNDASPYTIGVDFKLKVMSVEEETVKLQIWDSAGGERFRHPSPSYYRGASVVFMVFDTNSRASFEFLATFQQEMERFIGDRPVLIVLLGNKVDLDRVVERSEAEELVSSRPNGGMMYCECSAKSGDGINEVFEDVVTKIIQTPELWDQVFRPGEGNDAKEEENRGFGCCCC